MNAPAITELAPVLQRIRNRDTSGCCWKELVAGNVGEYAIEHAAESQCGDADCAHLAKWLPKIPLWKVQKLFGSPR